LPLFY